MPTVSELRTLKKPLPRPEIVLGDLANPQKEKWPGYNDPRDDYLRETDEHSTILFYFTKIMVMAPVFRASATEEPLSGYMSSALEAFLILTYVNNYYCWIEEANKAIKQSVISNLTEPSTGSKRMFTANSKGKGKFKGWGSDGMAMYKKLLEAIKMQRLDPNLQEVDKKLLEKFKEEVRGGGKCVEESDDIPGDHHALWEICKNDPNCPEPEKPQLCFTRRRKPKQSDKENDWSGSSRQVQPMQHVDIPEHNIIMPV